MDSTNMPKKVIYHKHESLPYRGYKATVSETGQIHKGSPEL